MNKEGKKAKKTGLSSLIVLLTLAVLTASFGFLVINVPQKLVILNTAASNGEATDDRTPITFPSPQEMEKIEKAFDFAESYVAAHVDEIIESLNAKNKFTKAVDGRRWEIDWHFGRPDVGLIFADEYSNEIVGYQMWVSIYDDKGVVVHCARIVFDTDFNIVLVDDYAPMGISSWSGDGYPDGYPGGG